LLVMLITSLERYRLVDVEITGNQPL